MIRERLLVTNNNDELASGLVIITALLPGYKYNAFII